MKKLILCAMFAGLTGCSSDAQHSGPAQTMQVIARDSREEPAEERFVERKSRPVDYNGWFVVNVKKVTPHVGYTYRGDVAKLDLLVKIEQVLKPARVEYANEHPRLNEGDEVTFVVDDSKIFGSDHLEGKRTVWGIQWWYTPAETFHIDAVSVPFADDKFTKDDLERLKAKLKSTPKGNVQ